MSIDNTFLHVLHLNNYFNFHVRLSFRPSVLRPSEIFFQFLQAYHKMSIIKVAWYVLRVKNMHPGSPSDPSGTAAAEAKPRCVYSILKPHGQSSRYQVRLLLPKQSQGAYTQFENHMVRVSSPPQSRSKAVVCVSTPRMYPRSGYFLV